MSKQKQDSKGLTLPVWTGDVQRDTEALNTYIETYGKQVGATPERIESVKQAGDRILTEGLDQFGALMMGAPVAEGDDHELFQWLENNVGAQFEGTDEEYGV